MRSDPAVLRLTQALTAFGATYGPAPLPARNRARQRQRLVAVMAVNPPAPDATTGRLATPRTSRATRRLAALGSSVAVMTAVAGVGVAGARSLPGQPFYDVKRATEAVQLWLARGDLAKGREHLEFARTRLAEARALPPTETSLITSTLARMDAETRDGSADLISAYRSSSSAEPLSDLASFAQQQYAGLVALAHRLPLTQQPVELRSLGVLGAVTQRVKQVADGCLTCLLPGQSGGGGAASPTPAPTPTPSPTQHRSAHPARSTEPRHHSTPSPAPSPTSPAPHHLLPTGPLLPSLPSLPSLLNPHHQTPAPPSKLLPSLLPSLLQSLSL